MFNMIMELVVSLIQLAAFIGLIKLGLDSFFYSLGDSYTYIKEYFSKCNAKSSGIYISVDIETTGLDDRSELLQIAAVVDDMKAPIKSLRTIDLPIKHVEIKYSEHIAMEMNADLLKKLENPDFLSYSPRDAANNLLNFLLEEQAKVGLDDKGKPRKVVFAGKNVASFDIPKLKKFFMDYLPERAYEFNNLVHYKTLDVGSLFFDVFKENVSLSEINNLTGRKQVSHNALDDAFDVVHAVRYKLGE